MTSVLVLALLGPQTYDLRLRPTGRPVVFNTVEDRTEGKEHTVFGTRFSLDVQSGLSATLVTGPFAAQGRTFGRPKTKTFRLTPKATLDGDAIGRPPFLLSLPLPARAVKAGESWTGAIVGPTPAPAGVKATITAIGPAKIANAPCLKVKLKIDTEMSGAKITGTGEMALRLGDGLVQTGTLSMLLVYHRPDPVTRKIVENTRVTIKASIKRS